MFNNYKCSYKLLLFSHLLLILVSHYLFVLTRKKLIHFSFHIVLYISFVQK